MSLESTSAGPDTFPIPDIIPIFPLPNVVFFPYTYLPLHIFEPRYREMVKDTALRGNCIGMALLKEGWEEIYHSNPSIFELGCVGRLLKVDKLPLGRYNIILQGLQRCDYVEEFPGTSYRRAKVSLYPSSEADTLDPHVRATLHEVADIYLQSKKAQDLCKVIASHKLPDSILVNSLSAGLDFTPLEKQFLLESDHLSQQARRLVELIKFKLPEPNLTQGQRS